jgi:uncharacterized membrane protein
MRTEPIWSPLDRTLIPLSLFILGLLLGAFFQASVRDYFWFLLVALIVLTLKPMYSYWRYRERRRGAEAVLGGRDEHD